MTTAFVIVAGIGWLTASLIARYWWHQAAFDQLTGLPQRARLENLARWARRHRRGSVGVLLLDLDRFKQINDTYGHRAGDQLLTAVAARLRQTRRRGETPIRLHGDEFALWLGPCDTHTAARRATEVAAALAEPVRVAGHDLVITASVGHATAAARAITLAALLHQADQSMYAAKRQRAATPTLPAAPGEPRPRDQRVEEVA